MRATQPPMPNSPHPEEDAKHPSRRTRVCSANAKSAGSLAPRSEDGEKPSPAVSKTCSQNLSDSALQILPASGPGLYCPRPDERGVQSRPKLPMSGRRPRGRRRVGSSTASHQASQSRLRAGVFDPSWLRGETNAAGIASGHNRRVQGLIGKALTRCTGHHWQWSQGPWGFPLGASISNSNRHIGKKRPIGARATRASPQQCGTGLPKAVTHAPRSLARGGRLKHPRR